VAAGGPFLLLERPEGDGTGLLSDLFFDDSSYFIGESALINGYFYIEGRRTSRFSITGMPDF